MEKRRGSKVHRLTVEQSLLASSLHQNRSSQDSMKTTSTLKEMAIVDQAVWEASWEIAANNAAMKLVNAAPSIVLKLPGELQLLISQMVVDCWRKG